MLACYSFRVIRDADIEIHEEEGADLRVSMELGLRQRRFGEPVALMVEKAMPERIRNLLGQRLGVPPQMLKISRSGWTALKSSPQSIGPT